jgi:hypothetical protein
MGISIYYTASRERPLNPAERGAVEAAVSRFSVEDLANEHSFKGEEFTGEAFCVYDPDDPSEPGIVFEGATKLPSNSEEAFWAAIQYWCRLLTEIRRIIPDADWRVHIDDHDIWWDPELREYDPAM